MGYFVTSRITTKFNIQISNEIRIYYFPYCLTLNISITDKNFILFFMVFVTVIFILFFKVTELGMGDKVFRMKPSFSSPLPRSV